MAATGSELSPFLAAIPLPVILIDADARIAALNAGAEAVFGRQGIGRHYASQLRQPPVTRLIEDALQNGKTGRARLRRPEGAREQLFVVHATPVEGQVVLAFEDLSSSEDVDQIRRDFVANVSHELKTPLTALLGFIETLRGPAREDAAARERFLGVMEREAGRMNRLVNDLLSLSRVESVARQRPETPVDLQALAQSAMTALRPMAAATGIEIVALWPEDLAQGDLTVPGDADQITQVLTNLLENAIKYGGSGERVEVGLKRLPYMPGLRSEAVQIEVRDFGEGFDPIHIPRLTERFYRVDAHRSREKGGTGLGLAIAKHIVSRHRGRINITSEPGQGAVFAILLPVD